MASEPSEKEIGMVSRGAEHSGPSDRRLEAQHSDGSQLRYRGYDIYPTDPVPPIPGWQKFAWTWAHKDYDGPEDGRCGCAESVAACKAEIDEREGEYPEGWTNAQAAKCPCRGSDDYCLCINEYWPERYGLTETEKCEDCGRLASDLTHRFCQQPDCPVRAMLAAQHPRADFDAQPSGAKGPMLLRKWETTRAGVKITLTRDIIGDADVALLHTAVRAFNSILSGALLKHDNTASDRLSEAKASEAGGE